MGFCILSLLNLFAFLIFTSMHARGVRGPNKYSFKRNYNVTWGLNNALLLNQETEVQLSMDQKSGCVSHFLLLISSFHKENKKRF